MIEGPRHFATCASEILPNVIVIYVDKSKLELGFYSECRINAVYIPGTLKIHSVKCTVNGKTCTLDFFASSVMIDASTSQTYEIVGALPNVGDYCLVLYKGTLFSGKLVALNDNGCVKVYCLQKAFAPKDSTWRWPKVDDIHNYPVADIKEKNQCS